MKTSVRVVVLACALGALNGCQRAPQSNASSAQAPPPPPPPPATPPLGTPMQPTLPGQTRTRGGLGNAMEPPTVAAPVTSPPPMVGSPSAPPMPSPQGTGGGMVAPAGSGAAPPGGQAPMGTGGGM